VLCWQQNARKRLRKHDALLPHCATSGATRAKTAATRQGWRLTMNAHANGRGQIATPLCGWLDEIEEDDDNPEWLQF
jgi:hypothetical protein